VHPPLAAWPAGPADPGEALPYSTKIYHSPGRRPMTYRQTADLTLFGLLALILLGGLWLLSSWWRGRS
jgi:hypothetical protein